MAEPTYSTPAPGPTAHDPHDPAAGTRGPSPRPGANLAELFVQDLPELPSLAALHALTDRDLPSTDGLPMPESMFQGPALRYTASALDHFFRGRSPGVCVASDLLVYDDGRPATNGPVRPVSVSPDIMVAMGVGDRMRSSYVIWREGKAPDFVMEVASESTWRRDRDEKPALYAALGVVEYFLYDAQGGYLVPRLQGQVLRGARRGPLRPERLGNGAWGLRSEVLGLCAYLRGPEKELRWHDPVTGRDLESHAEVHDARATAESRAAEEAAAREAAESRAAEEAAAREAAESRAAGEAAAREAAESRAAGETAARRAAEAEVAALRARIRRLEHGSNE